MVIRSPGLFSEIALSGHVLTVWPIKWPKFYLCFQISLIKRPVLYSVQIWECIALITLAGLIIVYYIKLKPGLVIQNLNFTNFVLTLSWR
jgi:hypothetical protein